MKQVYEKHFLDRAAEFIPYFFVFGIILVAKFVFMCMKRLFSFARKPAYASTNKQPMQRVMTKEAHSYDASFLKSKSSQSKMLIADETKFIPKLQGLKSGMYFYLYRNQGFIKRVQCDGKAVFKPFTIEDAKLNSLDFTIGGAIRFTKNEIKPIKKNEKSARITAKKDIPVQVVNSHFDMPPMEDPMSSSEMPVLEGEAVSAETPPDTRIISGKADDYFTVGPIARMGQVRKIDKNGKEYEIFALAVETKTGYKKEFCGEMLAEVVAKHGAEVGDKVKIRKAGKEVFTVTVKDKEETRTRNVFDFLVINN